ncbi:SE2200 family small protein [Staphylococcus haemolyticus]|nr:SE2200 family small protein [Staphylococcus haemolyticus]
MTNLKKLFVAIGICTIGYSILKRYQKYVNKIPNIEY